MAVQYGGRLKRAVTFHLPLVLLVGATLFPFYWMVITSIRPDRELYNVQSNPFFTLHPTVKHFQDLFELTMFARWAWNTLFIATVSTAISLFCGLLAGYALARLQFRWAAPLGTLIFVTYLVPPTLLFIPLGDVVQAFGLANTPWAVILTYPTFLIPFCTWLLLGYFKTIPKEIEECARIDGASRVQAMVRISFPLAVPGILSAGIFAFTLSWNEFLYALIFIQDETMTTVPVGLNLLIYGDVFHWGQLMAASVITTIPVVTLYMFIHRWMVEGLAAGSVKG